MDCEIPYFERLKDSDSLWTDRLLDCDCSWIEWMWEFIDWEVERFSLFMDQVTVTLQILRVWVTLTVHRNKD